MSGECDKCGEHAIDCICQNAPPNKIQPHLILRATAIILIIAHESYNAIYAIVSFCLNR